MLSTSSRLMLICIFPLLIASCSQEFPLCGSSKVTDILKSEVAKKYNEDIASQLDVNVTVAEEISFDNKSTIRSCKSVVEVALKNDIVTKFKEFEAKHKTDTSDKFRLYSYKADKERKLSFSDKVQVDFKVKKNDVDKGIFIEGTYNSENGFDINPIILKLIQNSDLILKSATNLSKLWILRDNASDDDGVSNTELIKFVTDSKILIESCQVMNPKYEIVCRFSNGAGYLDLYTTKPITINPNLVELFRPEPSDQNKEFKITDISKISEFLNTSFTFKFKNIKDKTCDTKPNMCEAYDL